MAEGELANADQVAALLDLGVREEQIASFFNGTAVAFLLPTETEPGIAVLQLVRPRLRSGIVEITDPGGGLISLMRFRSRSLRLAKLLGLTELELFGAEVLNQKLAATLSGHGFEAKEDRCPDELGNETMTILARVFAI
jgi:hypothetical protein